MGRVILVSNRLSASIERREGRFVYAPSIGGLATGVSSMFRENERLWIGWPGLSSEGLSAEEERSIRETLLARHQCIPVFLSNDEIERYYHGFCNDTLWPLFLYFPVYARYEESLWTAYRQVNEKFSAAALEVARPEDVIWIHDYQLMLLPGLIRAQRPDCKIGFFLHIPFPSFELFRLLPWRRPLLEGMLGADLVGFHTYDYVSHFVTCVRRLLAAEHSFGHIRYGNRLIKADVFPMGIDYERYAKALRRWEVHKEVRGLSRLADGRKTILSVDRLDYTKGIPRRLQAFKYFLEKYPEYRQKVKMVLIVAPSRTGVEKNQELLREVNILVSSINGTFGTIDWVPVLYFYRSFSFEKLTALYGIADVLLVTPMRDGMNLIAKEYIATRADRRGVLILGETAGAAQELGEALVVNPNDTEEIAEAIRTALEMSAAEQRARNQIMHRRLKRCTVRFWARDFLSKLESVRALQKQYEVKRLGEEARDRLLYEYLRAKSRLLFLDYDGTLVPFVDRPERAAPDRELKKLLTELAADPANEIVLISGRDRKNLVDWFGDLSVGLAAGHGAWVRMVGERRSERVPQDNIWKHSIRPLLDLHADRTPGALVEEKEHSLTWHFRKSDPELAAARLAELKEALHELTANLDLSVLEGNKVLEIKPASLTKGHAAARWLSRKRWDFILAIGDDWTDEDVFAALPDSAFSIRVGAEASRARYFLTSVADVRQLLRELLLCQQMGR